MMSVSMLPIADSTTTIISKAIANVYQNHKCAYTVMSNDTFDASVCMILVCKNLEICNISNTFSFWSCGYLSELDS